MSVCFLRKKEDVQKLNNSRGDPFPACADIPKLRREQVSSSLERAGRGDDAVGGAEWGVKKSISDEGERGKERKVAPEYYRARVRSETAAAVT